MSKKMAITLLLVLGGITVFVLQYTREPSKYSGEQAEESRPAPAFRLKDLSGQEVSLDQFKGKVVMLDFWATWCGPCRASMPELEKLQQQHPNDFTLLAVNLQEPADLVVPYVQSEKVKSRVLLDINGVAGSAYGISSIPMQAIIDKEGILRHRQLGMYPGWIEDLWSKIDQLR
jgi:thiol-disulfide isomerase/thioredoxin